MNKKKLFLKRVINLKIDSPINREKDLPLDFLKTEGKPDYLVIDHNLKIFFIIDAKNPEDDISKYNHLLYAYYAAFGINLIMITNGMEFRVAKKDATIIDQVQSKF